ncbi:MAG: helix-turn-helix domain-containing protein [Steroidobacteraceae bacterium]
MNRNPFLDLGFPREEATALHIRSQLAALLEQHIERKGWSQTAAARALKIPQPTVSKIINGKIEKLSIEFLIKLMIRAGLPVEVSAGRRASIRSNARQRPAPSHLSAPA